MFISRKGVERASDYCRPGEEGADWSRRGGERQGQTRPNVTPRAYNDMFCENGSRIQNDLLYVGKEAGEYDEFLW